MQDKVICPPALSHYFPSTWDGISLKKTQNKQTNKKKQQNKTTNFHTLHVKWIVVGHQDAFNGAKYSGTFESSHHQWDMQVSLFTLVSCRSCLNSNQFLRLCTQSVLLFLCSIECSLSYYSKSQRASSVVVDKHLRCLYNHNNYLLLVSQLIRTIV